MCILSSLCWPLIMSGLTLHAISFLPSLLACFFLLLAGFLLIGVAFEKDLPDTLWKFAIRKRMSKKAMALSPSTLAMTSEDHGK